MTAKPLFPFFHLLAVPAYHTTVVNRQGGVRNDQFLVDADDTSETLTLRTGPGGGVEREELVAGLLERDAVGLILRREVVADVRWREQKPHLSMTFVECCLGRVDHTGNGILAVINRHTVDDEVETSITSLTSRTSHVSQIVIDPLEVSIRIDPHIALQHICFQLLFQCPAFLQTDGCHDHKTGTLRIFEHLLYDILGGVFPYLFATHRTIRVPYARVKQSEIFVYLR